MMKSTLRAALLSASVMSLVAQLAACNNSAKQIGSNETAPAKPVNQNPQPVKPQPVKPQQSEPVAPQSTTPVNNQVQNQQQPIVPVAPTQPVIPVIQPVVQPVVVQPPVVVPVPSQPVVVPVQPVQPVQPQVVVQPVQPLQPIQQPESPSEGALLIPITPFSNMASGYQATNEGFRAILKDSSGRVIAAGPMSIDAAIKGYSDDATQGSAYGRLVLHVDLKFVDGAVRSGQSDGTAKGKLSICMASDTSAPFDAGSCKSLSGNLHPERPFQWIDKGVSYSIANNQIKITGYEGQTGEGGTRGQIALAAFHPAFGFAAPSKAFKDYQSPIVLDLNRNKQYDLIDVWDDANKIEFDMAASGKAVRTGWVAPQDGFLALDVNGDGKINSGAELFGEYSVGKVPAKGRGNTFENGFQALAQYDLNRDGRIDGKDAIFSKLVVWTDSNTNGLTDVGESKSLANFGIVSLDLAYESTSVNGKPLAVLDHEVRLKSTYTTKDGKKHGMADIWFKQRRSAQMASAE